MQKSPILDVRLAFKYTSDFPKHLWWSFFAQTANGHCVKSARIRSYSGPHFPAFGLHTKRYSVSLRIQSEWGKMRTWITPNTDTFYAQGFFTKNPHHRCLAMFLRLKCTIKYHILFICSNISTKTNAVRSMKSLSGVLTSDFF